MFLGTHYPKLDDKGRLFLPAKFREPLQGGLVITKGQEHCLYVFPREEFVAYARQLQAAPLSSKNARDYVRVLLSGASDELPDRQGRVTIPPTLREYAGLHQGVRRDRRRRPRRDLGRRALGRLPRHRVRARTPS